MTPTRYPHVFEPLVINGVPIRNRIVVPAHTTNYGVDHMPSERHVDYHRERARGGPGLIIFESIRVHPSSLSKPQGIAGYDPRCVEPFRRVADAVHGQSARLFGQIIHLGRQVDGDAVRAVPWGPSPIPWTTTAPVPHAMNEGDMADVVAGFVLSARHVLEAGLDGLEVHFGHGHLLQQFLSPASNARTDQYGGSEENRLRFPLEVLRAVRDAVGPDVCVGVRVSGHEYLDGGLTVDEMERIVVAVADAAQVDFVNVSHSAYHGSGSLSTQMADMQYPVDGFRDVARRMRRALRGAGHEMPTFAVCKVRTIAEAESILAAGDADMAGMARAHIADPSIVAHAAAGREHLTRTCIGCNQGCAGFLEKVLPITCLVNPAAGKEATWGDPVADPAPRPRRVLIIGAGPAGMEAAWVAAARGHDVTVWERSPRTGGRLRTLEQMPLRRDFLALGDWQEAACSRHGVTVRTSLDADVASVLAFAPDAVVVAAGARFNPPAIEGAVMVVTLEEALAAPERLGRDVAVVDRTGEWAAASVVEHLAGTGITVTAIATGDRFAWRVTIYSRTGLMDRIERLGVEVHTGRQVVGAEDGRLRISGLRGGATSLGPFSGVVVADHGVADDRLAAPLRSAGLEVHLAGDSLAARTALEAVYEGHEVGRLL